MSSSSILYSWYPNQQRMQRPMAAFPLHADAARCLLELCDPLSLAALRCCCSFLRDLVDKSSLWARHVTSLRRFPSIMWVEAAMKKRRDRRLCRVPMLHALFLVAMLDKPTHPYRTYMEVRLEMAAPVLSSMIGKVWNKILASLQKEYPDASLSKNMHRTSCTITDVDGMRASWPLRGRYLVSNTQAPRSTIRHLCAGVNYTGLCDRYSLFLNVRGKGSSTAAPYPEYIDVVWSGSSVLV
jgi:hypothetical protein